MATKQTETNQQSSFTPPELDVRIRPVNKGNVLAYASMNINKVFAIDGIKVLNGEKGIFVSMPSYRGSDGKYRDICFPINKEFRVQISETILNEYQHTLRQMQEAVQQYSEPGSELEPEMSM